jgi:hypothetical protein
MSSYPQTPLIPSQVESAFQSYTAQLLGLDITQEATWNSVRIAWQQQGQPAWGIKDDVVVVRAVQEDNPYDKQRDRGNAANNTETVQEIDTYIRVWRVFWTFYGPNSFDHARIIESGLFLDFQYPDIINVNLNLVTDITAPRRVPELFAKQWWERVDFSALFNELVTENRIVSTVASVNLEIIDANTTLADPLVDLEIQGD